MDKPVLGISACLIGEKVRYDGGHKYDRRLVEALIGSVHLLPVCPEVEMGLSVPREPMQLQPGQSAPRIVVIAGGIDRTDEMRQWCHGRLEELRGSGIRGFVFKSRSPSCGLRRVLVHRAGIEPDPAGIGVWAGEFIRANPGLPVAEEEDLHDPAALKQFLAALEASGNLGPAGGEHVVEPPLGEE